MRRLSILTVAAVLLAAQSTASAASRAPSCGQTRTAWHLTYDPALEATDGHARWSRCWRRPHRSTAAIVWVSGQAPQTLYVLLRPVRGGNYLLYVRDARPADLRAARRASRR